MITHARVQNFQSLREVDLDLGPFTCIVGPSNSGKSALLRALRALALNVSSPSIVTHGAKTATVEATLADEVRIELERGKAVSTYTVGEVGNPDGDAVYPKSNKGVPDLITQALKLGELNFAFQFDRPYLLADPPSKAAQALGELTNVTVIYDAVREANRRRLEVSSRLKVRRADQEALEQRALVYVGLKDRKKLLGRIRKEYDAVSEISAEADRLQGLIKIARSASAVSEAIDAQPDLPDVDLGKLEQMVAHTDRLGSLLTIARRSETDATLAQRDVDRLEGERDRYEEQIADLLVEAGTCPLCGQTVEVQHAH